MTDSSTCTSCHQSGVKIWRRHRAKRFCQKCYFKYFKKDNCSSCGKPSRLPSFVMNPICLDCERDVPCIRCGKKEYDIGKITEYGPACTSCAFYFKEPEQCQMCGKRSRRLSTYSHLDHDLKVCLKCMRKDYGTCKACQRYRQLYANDSDDMLCKKCLLIGEKPCKKCGHMMPAGYGVSCWDCYWSELLEKRIEMGLLTLTHKKLQERFSSYGFWLYGKIGANQSAIKINKHLTYFQEIDSVWDDVPDYKSLIDYFGANKMRLYRLPMQWFVEKLKMEVDEDYKLEITEKGRIDKVMASIMSSNPIHCVLEEYKTSLFKKFDVKKTSIRSIRLTLSAAAGMLKPLNDESVLTQEYLDSHMIRKPGQKANLTGFMNFYNDATDMALKLRVDDKKANAYRRKELKKILIGLLIKQNTVDQRKWLLYGLQYFHHLPQSIAGNALNNGHVTMNDEGSLISWKSNDYFIPNQKTIDLFFDDKSRNVEPNSPC